MWWPQRGRPLAYILAVCLYVYGCGEAGTKHEDAGRKGPQMSLEKIHFYEVEKEAVRWEGWAQGAVAQERNGRIVFSGVRLVMSDEGHQTWMIEGESGVWEPEVKRIRSEESVRMSGPGITVEGKNFDLDLSLQAATIGRDVSASVEGFWLEQR